MSTYTIPNVVKRHDRGDRVMDVYSHLLGERIVYLGTEIDDGVANALIAQILHLQSEDTSAPINLYINSPGGSYTSMLGLYDTMQFVSVPVATTCVGQACSTAACLLAAGEPGQRNVLAHSRVLLHQPSAQSRGTIPDLILQADEVLRLRGEVEQILSAHTGQRVDQLRRDTDRDQIFPARAAVAYGLADQVIEPSSVAPGPG